MGHTFSYRSALLQCGLAEVGSCQCKVPSIMVPASMDGLHRGSRCCDICTTNLCAFNDTSGLLTRTVHVTIRRNFYGCSHLRMALSQPSAEDGKMSTLLRQESCRSPVRSPGSLSSAPSTPMTSRQGSHMMPMNDARAGGVSAVLDRYTSGRTKRLPTFQPSPTMPPVT